MPALTKPGSYDLRVEDGQGLAIARASVTVIDAQWEKENLPVSRRMSSLRPLPGEVEALRKMRETVTPSFFLEPSLRPPVESCINTPFGVERLHNGKSSGRYHAGLDHRAGAGMPIRAAGDGIVGMARMWRLPGGTVGIDHGQGVVTMYMHQSRFAVKPGQSVRAGQVIGYVGMTGFATGPHLHWSLYVHGVPVNPVEWTPGMHTCAPRSQ